MIIISRRCWLISFLTILACHIFAFGYLFTNRNTISLEQNFGGFDYPIKGDKFESIMIVSDLPIGDFKEAAINSVKASSAEPEPHIQTDEPEISSIQNIDSPIEAVQKPKILPKEKPRKITKKNIRPAVQKNASKNDNTAKNDSQSNFNSAAKDGAASAPISGNGNTITSNSSGMGGGAQRSWKGAVMSHLNKHKRYPQTALAQGEEGIVYVKVQISPSGKIINVSVKNGVKFEALNSEAVQLFYRASPLPTPPSEYFANSNELTLHFPVEFNIKKYKEQKINF